MLKEMFKMQKFLNDETNGVEWLEGKTNKGKEINWMRCFRLELAEAIDQSTNWKHWKNTIGVEQYSFIENSGATNFKVEIADAWHFIMSEIIARGWEDYFNSDKLFDGIKIEKISNKELIELTEEVNFLSFTYERRIKLIKNIVKYNPSYRDYKNDIGLIDMLDLVEKFVILTLSVMSLKELYELYIVKNGLNFFRQENGYKDGTYIKEWGPEKIEDNVFLDKYLKDGNEIKLSSIKDYLLKEYKRLNNL